MLVIIAGWASSQPPDPAGCPAAPATPGKLRLMAYPVAEIVVPIGDRSASPKTLEADLMKTIRETIAPNTWASSGGKGTIDYFPMSMSLVVNQTPDIQEMIAELLTKLRQEQNTEVVLEVRLLSLPEGFFERPAIERRIGPDGLERIGIDFSKRSCVPAPAAASCPRSEGSLSSSTPGPKFLSEREVNDLLQSLQGEQRANIMQAPKLTLFNNQTAQIDCSNKHRFVTGCQVVQRDGEALIIPRTEDVVTGFRMTVCPKLAADHRFVQVNLDINKTDLASPVVPLCPVTVQIKGDHDKPAPSTHMLQQPKVTILHIAKTVTIPDGGTVLLGGLKRETEVRHEYATPVLSKVPYLDRLFKNVGYGREGESVYVLVTSRILVNEEEDPKASAAGPRKDVPCCTAAPKHGGAEEAEAPPVPRNTQAKVLVELLQAYDEACAAGRKKEAARFARAALTIDPTCFAKRNER